MRPWDNFFWWLEVGELPEKSMIAPASWPPPRAARPFPVGSSLTANNKILVSSPMGKAMIGKKVGEVVEVQAPAGMLKYEIRKIS